MINPSSTVEPIPLHRMDYTKQTSSIYTPSEYTTAPSTLASTTASLLPTPKTSAFHPTSALQIQTPGKSPISLPLPQKDLITPIFSPATTDRPLYLSIRPKRSSGSCALVGADDESETSIARTTYHFGPGRSPTVKIGRDDDVDANVFEVHGKGLLTRSVWFESRKWGRFEWRYAPKRERGAVAVIAGMEREINNLLVLEKVWKGEQGKEERMKVAQLVRGEGTRTPWTKRRDAGNGGRLEMCLNDGEGRTLLDDLTVLVTALLMLKKEVDRLRATQIAIMAGAAGGGS